MSQVETGLEQALINISPEAQKQFLTIMHENENQYKFLRLGVNASGCSGYSYLVLFENYKKGTDQQIDFGELSVLISADSIEMVKGANIDYQTDENRSGFVIDNPSKSGSCGCGGSCGC